LTSLNRPVTAFLTFENEEGLNRCKKYDEIVSHDDAYASIRTLLDQPLNFKDAAEPTDIIWENRHFTNFERAKRTVYVIIIVAFLLFISFIIIFYCSKEATKPLLKYPAVDCPSIK
jgi:hypothetical protein